MNALGGSEFEAVSAGSYPTGKVNPAALRQLAAEGIATDGLSSKSWDDFIAGEPIDMIITVCDAAAGEACPVIPGQPPTAHWGIPDPAAAAPDVINEAFRQAWHILHKRIQALVSLPLADMSVAERRAAVQRIADEYPA